MHLWAGCAAVISAVGKQGLEDEEFEFSLEFIQLHSELESSLGYKDPVSINQTKPNQTNKRSTVVANVTEGPGKMNRWVNCLLHKHKYMILDP